jgi:hypothetical protein
VSIVNEPHGRPNVGGIVTAPSRSNDAGLSILQFALLGVWFRLLVGSVPAWARSVSFIDHGHVLLSDGARFLRDFAPAAQATTPKGCLANRRNS